MERVAGIEPASSAWKAEVLPLNHTRVPLSQLVWTANLDWAALKIWWWEKDSNLRRHSRQIYSLIPLTAREPHQIFLHPTCFAHLIFRPMVRHTFPFRCSRFRPMQPSWAGR